MGSEAGEARRRPSLTLGEGDTEGRLDGGIQTGFQFKDVPTGSRSHSTRQKNAVSARNRPKHCCGKQGSVKRSGWTSEQGTWCSLPRTHPGPGGLGGTVSTAARRGTGAVFSSASDLSALKPHLESPAPLCSLVPRGQDCIKEFKAQTL